MIRRKELIQGIEAHLGTCSQELMAASETFNAAIEESMTALQDCFMATQWVLDDQVAGYVGRGEVHQDNLESRFAWLERHLVEVEEKVACQDDTGGRPPLTWGVTNPILDFKNK